MGFFNLPPESLHSTVLLATSHGRARGGAIVRVLSLALLILVLSCGIALAGKNRNGSLIVHTNDAYSYSATGLCERFETQDDPGDCQSAGTRTDLDPGTAALIWLIASFPQTDNPGVVVIYFGIDHNLSPGSIPQWGFCGPAGSLEIPDAGWPDTGGNSVAFGSPIIGDTFFPFYTFNCYGGAGSYFGSGINPTGGYAAFVDDSNPPLRTWSEDSGRCDGAPPERTIAIFLRS
jgi:hypothetical protein